MKTESNGAVARLQRAINEHDLEALVACFDDRVHSEQPVHPDRAFDGTDSIRQNWAQIFGGVPDLHAEILDAIQQDETAWVEWRWTGTRRDGATFDMRGVTKLGIAGHRIKSVRMYMEPISTGGGNEGAIRQAVAGGQPR